MSDSATLSVRPPSGPGDPRLAEVVRRLRDAYRPLRIYLFGSVARGDSGPDSDFDVCVVVPDDASRERRDSKLGYRALGGLGIATDVVVWTLEDFERPLHLKASFPSTILREGMLLYAA